MPVTAGPWPVRAGMPHLTVSVHRLLALRVRIVPVGGGRATLSHVRAGPPLWIGIIVTARALTRRDRDSEPDSEPGPANFNDSKEWACL